MSNKAKEVGNFILGLIVIITAITILYMAISYSRAQVDNVFNEGGLYDWD